MKGFSAVKIRDRFLRNVHEDDEDQYKLLLTQTDKESLIATDRSEADAQRVFGASKGEL